MVHPGTSGTSGPQVGGFRPSHVVPAEGLPAWEAPDPDRPTVPLDPFLPVQLVDRVGDWGEVLCSNGWSAWVDGRLLVSVPPDPPAVGRPMGTAADPRPLLVRAEESLRRYRRAVEELVAGRLDGETFRLRTRGLRLGLVVDGEALWSYDAEHERWLYCDGTRLSTYAASSPPSAAEPEAPPAPSPVRPEPTRVVDPAALRDPAAPPDPTAVVDPAALREPTAVVDPAALPDPAAPPDPTAVVDHAALPDPTAVVDHAAVPDGGAEPTRLVERGERDDGEGGPPEGPLDRAGDG
ncbi:hypothetical protein QWM81_04000 [Streptomyces ficellus]|uniref:Uncharacterized protein n=1 Tax=Streptomyces ficellus TaxID=1977088 RepID=A0ABT7Z167_9ACTN|nr:hypothetical protein [Streptomyces ficellus]MDN3293225.1 hypothetical protein [Streptomyces ficellus]